MTSGWPIKLRDGGDEYDLGTVLNSLKARGCSILVAGDVPNGASQLVSQHLFGHPDEHRDRVLVKLRSTNSLEEWFPAGISSDDPQTRIIDYTGLERSVAEEDFGFDAVRWNSKFATTETPESASTETPAFSSTETPGRSQHVDIDGCTGQIDAIAAEAGSLDPSQLRVGVFSLNVLDDSEAMVDTVSSVSSTVTAHRGMVHYHLQQPATSTNVQTLLKHVDAMITIRKEVPNEPPLQRWTIPGYGDSLWIPLRRPK